MWSILAAGLWWLRSKSPLTRASLSTCSQWAASPVKQATRASNQLEAASWSGSAPVWSIASELGHHWWSLTGHYLTQTSTQPSSPHLSTGSALVLGRLFTHAAMKPEHPPTATPSPSWSWLHSTFAESLSRQNGTRRRREECFATSSGSNLYSPWSCCQLGVLCFWVTRQNHPGLSLTLLVRLLCRRAPLTVFHPFLSCQYCKTQSYRVTANFWTQTVLFDWSKLAIISGLGRPQSGWLSHRGGSVLWAGQSLIDLHHHYRPRSDDTAVTT